MPSSSTRWTTTLSFLINYKINTMFKSNCLVVLACGVTCVLAAARIFPYEPKPAIFACKPGCYLSILGFVIPYNQPYYPKGKCEVYKCQTDNTTYWESCGVIAVPPECRVVQDRSKRYPDCCSKAVCDTTTQPPTTTEATCDDSTNV